MSRPTVAVLLAALLAPPAAAAPPAPGERPAVVALPQSFVETGTGFAVLGDGLTAVVEAGGLRWILSADDGTRRAIDVTPVGGDPDAAPVGLERLPGRISAFHGPRERWRTRATFRSVRYADVWPGVDLRLDAEGSTVKGTWTVAPGVDPTCIRLRHTGADSVTLDAAGRLVLGTTAGELVDDAPVAWQELDGERREVPVAFDLTPLGDGAADVAFRLGDHDPSAPLLIDPAVIVQAGFLGGADDDTATAIHVGADGSVYLGGNTKSADFPALIGPELVHDSPGQSTANDCWVAKLDPTGTTLLYAGFLGGTKHDTLYAIDVDASGRLHFGGTANSSEAQGFPGTGQPELYWGNYDGFVGRLSADGGTIEYCGFIGGNSDDRLFDIDVDDLGRLYAVGRFQSLEHTLPLWIGPDLTQPGGSTDGFIARVSASGNAIDFCGYLGGDDLEDITEVVADPNGGAWFSGYTWSSDFPVVGTLGAGNGSIEAVVGHVADDGTQLTACGMFGGLGSEFPASIDLGPDGSIYVAGFTFDATTFPAQGGPLLTPAGATDGFVARIAPGGGSIDWAGFMGTGGNGSLVHDGTHAWMLSDPTSGDAVLQRIAADGTSYDRSATLPMPDDTVLWRFGAVPAGLAAPGTDAFWIAGWTSADETTFPVVSGPDVTANGGSDAIVLQVQLSDATWTDLGQGLAGTSGVPLQTGTGTLAALTPFSIDVTSARANATAWFVFGLALLQAPFKGGVMVPDPAPPAILLPLLTSPVGDVSFAATWPAGVPGGFSIYTQWWVEDPAGPAGFAASNGLQGTTP